MGLALAGVVCADEGPDHNEDVGAEEWGISDEQLKALFQKVDKDGDGKVTAADLHAFALGMRLKRAEGYQEQAFAELDQDKDGLVSLAEATADFELDGVEGDQEAIVEHRASRTVMFKAADKDGDGFLTKTEAIGFTNMEHDPAVEAAVAKFEIKKNDTNGDGKLSPKEFAWHLGAGVIGDEEGLMEHFAELDRNTDGFLDLEEMREYESVRHYEEQELSELAGKADKDGDGSITLQELVDTHHDDEKSEHHYHLENWARELEL